MENFQFLKLKIETCRHLFFRNKKMKTLFFMFIMTPILAFNKMNAPHRLVNYVARGTLNYYKNYVNEKDLRQEIWAHFYENQKDPELQKLMFKNIRRYSSRERRKKLKTRLLDVFNVNKNFEYVDDFYPTIDDSNLSNDEKKIVELLLQKKSTLEIMDTLKCTFPKYKKYISKIRKKISFLNV